jgi:hypothetical protein
MSSFEEWGAQATTNVRLYLFMRISGPEPIMKRQGIHAEEETDSRGGSDCPVRSLSKNNARAQALHLMLRSDLLAGLFSLDVSTVLRASADPERDDEAILQLKHRKN